jgi:two-component system response regulator MtrA
VDERVLLVEDDPSIRELAQLGLTAAGFRVTTCADGREALERLRRDPFDLAVLDVMLPTLDGFEITREVRKDSRIPIVMLTARADATDVIVGLELGADDYVTKPFDMPILVARCRAVLRRANAEPAEPVLRIGDLEIDPAAFQVRRNGDDLGLTATEFRLLLELARHPGQVMTRDVLLQRVWDHEFLGDSRLVDVAVQRLRGKIEADPSRPSLIATVRGVGYRFERG